MRWPVAMAAVGYLRRREKRARDAAWQRSMPEQQRRNITRGVREPRRPMWTMTLHRDPVVEGTAIGRVERPRARRRLVVHFGGKRSQAVRKHVTDPHALTLSRSTVNTFVVFHPCLTVRPRIVPHQLGHITPAHRFPLRPPAAGRRLGIFNSRVAQTTASPRAGDLGAVAAPNSTYSRAAARAA